MEAVSPIQIGMMVELATSNPMNVVLIRRRQARDAPTRAGSCGGEIASYTRGWAIGSEPWRCLTPGRSAATLVLAQDRAGLGWDAPE